MRSFLKSTNACETHGRRLLVTTSWDDGHPSDLRLADLLEKHGLRGTFYVPCANSEGRPVMRPSEVVEVGRRFEIGGHTRSHVSLTEMTPCQATDQIRANKDRLQNLLGREVCGFAYVRGRHNPMVRVSWTKRVTSTPERSRT